MRPKIWEASINIGEVLQYAREMRNNIYSVSHEMMQLKSLQIAKKNIISMQDSMASMGWTTNFMKRNNLS
jgi:hypothetical protein